MKIILFGQLVDITGTRNLEVGELADTDSLRQHLIREFPALNNLKFAIAVNKTIVRENTVLTESATVALMPPFSGG